MEFSFNGVMLSVADFPNTLEGYIAFSIAFANNVRCANKEAAIELLLHEAGELIEKVRDGSI